MDAGIIVLFIFVFFIIYWFYIHPLILHLIFNKKYKCLRCGRCCRLKAKLTLEDIKRIKKAGYKDFVDSKKYLSLKRINGYCKFLSIKNGIATCTIEDIKPELCGNWPVHKTICGKSMDSRCKFFDRKKFFFG